MRAWTVDMITNNGQRSILMTTTTRLAATDIALSFLLTDQEAVTQLEISAD
jgi:hypothetical protein